VNCLGLAVPIDPHAPLAGVWGEPSPQVPPEARWTAGRSQGASQPWAEGEMERRLFTDPGSLSYRGRIVCRDWSRIGREMCAQSLVRSPNESRWPYMRLLAPESVPLMLQYDHPTLG